MQKALGSIPSTTKKGGREWEKLNQLEIIFFSPASSSPDIMPSSCKPAGIWGWGKKSLGDKLK
jgi:hypothetical protein